MLEAHAARALVPSPRRSSGILAGCELTERAQSRSKRMSCLRFLLTLMLGLLVFDGCGGPIGHITQAEEPDRYVRVEAQSHGERVGESSFTHPVTLSTTDWERILSLVQVKPRPVGSFLPTNTDPEPPLWRDNEKRPVQILGGAQQVRALLVH